MPRLIARFLLFVAFAGNVTPLVVAATAPPHACCVRKAVHHCHDSLPSELVPESGQLLLRNPGSCNHDCCRALTTAQWAQTQPPAAATFGQHVEAYLDQSTPLSPNTEVSRFQSTRAPPHLFLA